MTNNEYTIYMCNNVAIPSIGKKAPSPTKTWIYNGPPLFLKVFTKISKNNWRQPKSLFASGAWAKFSLFRSELVNKKANLYDKLRLFNSVVTPCALYGCGSWSLTKDQENRMKVVQRRMVRAILGKRRLPLETDSDETSSVQTGADAETESA